MASYAHSNPLCLFSNGKGNGRFTLESGRDFNIAQVFQCEDSLENLYPFRLRDWAVLDPKRVDLAMFHCAGY